MTNGSNGGSLGELKVDINKLIDIVQHWRKLGYTEDETQRFFEAVMNNLAHLVKK